MEKQRTVSRTVTVKGVGLQTGVKVSITLKSSPPDSGISFVRIDLPGRPVININSIESGSSGFARRTTLGHGRAHVQTAEHLLAALSGISIDNIVVELDACELPGLDGSAAGFVEAIKEAGIIEQDAQRREIKVDKEISCRHKDSLITVLPDECFRISYTLEYKDISIGRQDLSITVDRKSFEESIAPARTFCLKKEALMLRMLGLGKGADYSNTLVIGKNGPLNNEFRFPDEPVRHKILDLIGDLYTLGMPVKGRFVCVKSGHRLNAQIVEKIRNSKLSSK